MSGSIYSWSTTAGDNDDADGDINWTEGQNAKTVNNSARQMMGRVAELLLDLGGQGTVGGTANAITLTLESSFTALVDGLLCSFQPTADNTGAAAINVNSIGSKSIRKFDTTGEVALASGDLQAGNFYLLIYDTGANSSAGAWIVLNPTPAEYQAKSSKLTDIAALSATDSNIIVGNGTTWVAESGATARTSLGLGSAAITAASAYATAAQGTKADGATQATDLASTAASKGASLVGIQDSGSLITATTVEAALAELAAKVKAVQTVYKSAAQVITAAGTLTLAHGLAAAPTRFALSLVCITAEQGYTTGDETPVQLGASAYSDHQGAAILADASNIYIKYGSNSKTFTLLSQTSGNSYAITNTNWKMIVRAWI